MLYSLAPAAGYRLAGLKTLLLAPWSGSAVYSYASATRSHLTNFSGLIGWELVPCDVPQACEFGEAAARGKNGLVYPQGVTVVLPGLSAERRTAVEGLLRQGPVVALCEDFSGQWWLYGQTAGLRLLAATAKSGVFGGESSWALPITGTQTEAARTVAQSRVNLLYNSSISFSYPA